MSCAQRLASCRTLPVSCVHAPPPCSQHPLLPSQDQHLTLLCAAWFLVQDRACPRAPVSAQRGRAASPPRASFGLTVQHSLCVFGGATSAAVTNKPTASVAPCSHFPSRQVTAVWALGSHTCCGVTEGARPCPYHGPCQPLPPAGRYVTRVCRGPAP